MCLAPSWGTPRGPKEASDSVRPPSPRRQLGKTFYLAVRGREVMANSVRVVGKHPLPISQSREWFALYCLCQQQDGCRSHKSQSGNLAESPTARDGAVVCPFPIATLAPPLGRILAIDTLA